MCGLIYIDDVTDLHMVCQNYIDDVPNLQEKQKSKKIKSNVFSIY